MSMSMKKVITILSPTSAAVLHTIEREGEDNINVNLGDTVITLESCKMEIPVNSPASGLIKFFVQPGEVVAEGQKLAEIIVL